MTNDLADAVIGRTLRVPLPDGPDGDGTVVARQLDAALMSVGFKLASDLYDGFAGLAEGAAVDAGVALLRAVRRTVGDHVEHNVYFRDFPRNVPHTAEFWLQCLTDALQDPVAAGRLQASAALGVFNLLDLPRYGRYQHHYAEMLAAHDEFIAAATDRVTVLHRGGTLDEELRALYLVLAGLPTPLGDADRELLAQLVPHCVDGVQPQAIPVRETRALINAGRLVAGSEPLLDTVTDVLRAACAMCGGDVSLVEPTRFAAMPRRARRALLAGLDRVVAANPAKLADVNRHAERWKRLGERVHPHEYPQWPNAARVFAVARGVERVPTLQARYEELLGRGDVAGAARLLGIAPGALLRAADRLLRSCPTDAARQEVFDVIAGCVQAASGRVLLSVREHFGNRAAGQGRPRAIVNQSARSRVVVDTRAPLDAQVVDPLIMLLDKEIRGRLEFPGRLVVDPDMRNVALPVSGKAMAGGHGVLPRGSVTPISGALLRFFVHWKQRARQTDYDLSALMLDEHFDNPSWVSFTNLSEYGAVHSGDIVDAPEGASEFIDVELSNVQASVVLPQVLIYNGEGFDEVEESFFGFMLREPEQEGMPFEPATVRMKSELRGSGRVALPVAFVRDDAGGWRARWLHLRLRGRPVFNQIEANRTTTTALLRALVGRTYLTVGYLADLFAVEGEPSPGEPVTYIGFDDPGDLPPGSMVVTPRNLGDLIPL